jgi:hypothetical protein
MYVSSPNLNPETESVGCKQNILLSSLSFSHRWAFGPSASLHERNSFMHWLESSLAAEKRRLFERVGKTKKKNSPITAESVPCGLTCAPQ